MQGIFFKLDWYSAMFHDTSIQDLMLWLGLDPNVYFDEFLRGQLERSQSFETKVIFHFENVSFEIKQSDFLTKEGDCFDSIYSVVRLDISGTGLDFLRSLKIDIDTKLRDYKHYPDVQYNVTRCDFAFDLVNYQPHFLSHLISYVQSNITPAGYVSVYRRPGGVKCSLNLGGRSVVYFGSPTSQQMLRCYDKRLQFIDLNTGCYTKENPYENPDSWIRLELQTRRDKAQGLLFGTFTDDFGLSVFRYLFEQYKFNDLVNTTENDRKPAQFWLDLFDWDKIPELVQNTHFV